MVRNLSATNVSWDLSGTYVLSKETNLFARRFRLPRTVGPGPPVRHRQPAEHRQFRESDLGRSRYQAGSVRPPRVCRPAPTATRSRTCS
ncbi:hypothetical protein LP420_11410 [Massilia sp. B-10]|nr:hypothetical protein LP420_11410 [Massilia sp. B-10]